MEAETQIQTFPLPPEVLAAIRSGPIPVIRDWRSLPNEQLTRAEVVMRFAERYLIVPEGKLVGKPIRLILFQEAFIYSIFDNPVPTRKAYLSLGRKNGKTALIGIILLAFIIGPESIKNSQIISGAKSREQAALVYKLMLKMLRQNDLLTPYYRAVESRRMLFGKGRDVEYKAIAAEAATSHGLSPMIALLDEVGQVIGPIDKFIEAVETAQGAYDHPLLIAISTQASGDQDLFSIWLDDAIRSPQTDTVCHFYETPKQFEMDDQEGWKYSNPAIDVFRSREDLLRNVEDGKRIAAKEASVRNLFLNQRISAEGLCFSPTAWKQCDEKPDDELFMKLPVSIGLDLSQRTDLTAAVLSVMDDKGEVHLQTHVFIPQENMLLREAKDKAPYALWVKQGLLIAVPGKTISYDWVAEYLKLHTQGMDVNQILFDRWRIKEFQSACDRAEFAPASWKEVGQGYKDFSPAIENFENFLLDRKIRHGGHPLLNLAVSSAVAVMDPAGNRKLDKSRQSARIDPIVAAIMACSNLRDLTKFDVNSMIA